MYTITPKAIHKHGMHDDHGAIAHIAAPQPHSTHVKSTAGGTVSVSTAAELTSALSALAAAPNLLGDVIIQITADISGTGFVIPALQYNGYTLTLQGSYTTILSGVATGGAATNAAGGTKGYLEDILSGWGVNAYRHMILQNQQGDRTPIASNTATRIYHTSVASDGTAAPFRTPVLSDSFVVLDWDIEVTHTGEYAFSVQEHAQVTFKDLKISNTLNTGTNVAVLGNAYSRIIYVNCLVVGSTNFGGSRHIMNASVWPRGSIFESNSCSIRLENATYFSRFYPANIYCLGSAPTGYICGVYLVNSSSMMDFDDLFDGITLIAGSEGLISYDDSHALLVFCFIENWTIGILAQYSSFARQAACSYSGNTTDRTPAAAADPSYIG